MHGTGRSRRTDREVRDRPPHDRPPADRGLTAGQLLTWLRTDAFPGNRELLVAAASANRAPRRLVDSLRLLPPGLVYQDAEQLADGLRRRRARPIRCRP